MSDVPASDILQQFAKPAINAIQIKDTINNTSVTVTFVWNVLLAVFLWFCQLVCTRLVDWTRYCYELAYSWISLLYLDGPTGAPNQSGLYKPCCQGTRPQVATTNWNHPCAIRQWIIITRQKQLCAFYRLSVNEFMWFGTWRAGSLSRFLLSIELDFPRDHIRLRVNKPYRKFPANFLY